METFNNSTFLMPLHKIVMLKGDKNYTHIIYSDGKQFLSSYTLKKFEIIANSQTGFMRVHKSHIVNLAFLTDFDIVNESLTLNNYIKLPVSRRKMIGFKRYLRVC